ncbi:MAG TPA: hypothetical protein VLA16_21120 [Ideonella sp.]|nr:hypothetical protein [Ideonella sp.]
MSNSIQSTLAFGAAGTGTSSGDSWFEAMADAWGKALDEQAVAIEEKSAGMTGNGDMPADVTELTAMSLKMSFLASSSHTAISSVGAALETMARKQ